MSPQDKILDKLSKLKASAEGEAKLGNTAAAEAFASAINRMLLEHELSMTDIPVAGVKEEPIVEVRVNLDAHGIKFSRVRIGWQEALARVVAPAHLCKFLITTGSNYITFVGTTQHATIAEYAYGVLAGAADRMSKEARDEYWRLHRDEPDFESGNFRAAWLQGFIERIAERFREALAAEVKAAPAGESQALMRVNTALTRAKDYVAEKYKKSTPAAHMGSGISKGYHEGRKAADKITLGQKSVGTSTPKRLA